MGSTQDHPAPFNLTEVDRQVLAQTDEEFAYHDWEELKDIVGEWCLCLSIAFTPSL
jgi:hypothetical protein